MSPKIEAAIGKLDNSSEQNTGLSIFEVIDRETLTSTLSDLAAHTRADTVCRTCTELDREEQDAVDAQFEDAGYRRALREAWQAIDDDDGARPLAEVFADLLLPDGVSMDGKR